MKNIQEQQQKNAAQRSIHQIELTQLLVIFILNNVKSLFDHAKIYMT